MPALWWLRREAERFAQRGDFERAYEIVRDLVPSGETDLEQDLTDTKKYVAELEDNVIELEKRLDRIENE